jgi:FlaA1/EpsC-like NDP-sugar epimerase
MSMAGSVSRRINRMDAFILLFIDIGVILFSLFCVQQVFGNEYLLRNTLNRYTYPLFFIITIPVFYFFDLYYTLKDFRRYRQLVNLILAVGVSVILLILLTLWGKEIFLGRRYILVYTCVLFSLTLANRMAFSALRKRVFCKNAIIIGCSKISRDVCAIIGRKDMGGKELGINILGYLADMTYENEDA